MATGTAEHEAGGVPRRGRWSLWTVGVGAIARVPPARRVRIGPGLIGTTMPPAGSTMLRNGSAFPA